MIYRRLNLIRFVESWANIFPWLVSRPVHIWRKQYSCVLTHEWLVGTPAMGFRVRVSTFQILLFLLFTTTSVFSQNSLSLPQAIDLALRQNQAIGIGNLEISGQKILQKTAIDLQFGRTQAFYRNDYTTSFMQSIPLFTLLKAQENLLKNAVDVSEKRLVFTKNEIIHQVKSLYYQALIQKEFVKILRQQDSLYTIASNAATIRFKIGETNLLEKMTTQTRQREIEQRIKNTEMDLRVILLHLKTLTGSLDSVQIDFGTAFKHQFNNNNKTLTEGNPLAGILQKELVISKLQTVVEQKRLNPDFRVGLINQSIEGNINLNVIQVGISLPIFAQAQKARIQAATVNEKIAQSRLDYTISQLESQLNTAKILLEKSQNSLTYYETSALPQADLILKTALKNYQLGEIEYVEFIQNISQAWAVKESYLSEIQNFNQNIINIESLLGYE
jgi:heavy metal efflux system protein